MKVIFDITWMAALGTSAAMLGSLVAFDVATALTLEEAREKCRETIGRPIVHACMRGLGYGPGMGRGGANKDADREGCRHKASPQVRACVEKMLTAAHGRPNVPVAVPEEKDAGPSAPDAPSAFVAPSRTISDIAAILDNERPDPV